MNKLRSMAAFGLMLFTAWAINTSPSQGAEAVCPCTPVGGSLAASLLLNEFPAAAGAPEGTVCDTRPEVFSDSGMTAGPDGVEAKAQNSGTLIPTFLATVYFDDRRGECLFLPEGPFTRLNLDRAVGWRCIRDVTAACRDLGY